MEIDCAFTDGICVCSNQAGGHGVLRVSANVCKAAQTLPHNIHLVISMLVQRWPATVSQSYLATMRMEVEAMVLTQWYWLSMRQKQMVLFTRGEDCCCRAWWSGNTGLPQITAAECSCLLLYCHHNNTHLKVHFAICDVATPDVVVSVGLGSSEV